MSKRSLLLVGLVFCICGAGSPALASVYLHDDSYCPMVRDVLSLTSGNRGVGGTPYLGAGHEGAYYDGINGDSGWTLITDTLTPGGDVYPKGINTSGLVAGSIYDGSNYTKGFTWTVAGGMVALAKPTGLGGIFAQAGDTLRISEEGINDSGQILAEVVNSSEGSTAEYITLYTPGSGWSTPVAASNAGMTLKGLNNLGHGVVYVSNAKRSYFYDGNSLAEVKEFGAEARNYLRDIDDYDRMVGYDNNVNSTSYKKGVIFQRKGDGGYPWQKTAVDPLPGFSWLRFEAITALSETHYIAFGVSSDTETGYGDTTIFSNQPFVDVNGVTQPAGAHQLLLPTGGSYRYIYDSYGLDIAGFVSLGGDNYAMHMAIPDPGDVDGDGFVGGSDLTIIIENWGMTGANRIQGDLTGDGNVGAGDYTQVQANWGTGTPPEPPSAPIPEPATMGLLLVGVLAGLIRRSPRGSGIVAVLALSMIGLLAPQAMAYPVWVDASTYGYNPTDATAALQGAIDSRAETVFVPYMGAGNDWIVEPINLVWNQTIIFEENVLVKAKAGSFLGTSDCLFSSNDSNVTLIGYGATLQMRQDDYLNDPPYTPSEHRAGIKLDKAHNFEIKGFTIKDTGGDGIYVGAWDHTASGNIIIKDVTIDNAYRNGISVTAGENVLIDNVIITNTSGTDPQTGIDIEANYTDQPMTNIVIRNSIIQANNKQGITFSTTDEPGRTVSGSVENCTIIGNGTAGTYEGLHMIEGLPNVTIKDSLFVDNTGAGFNVTNTPTHDVEYSAFWNNTGGAVAGQGVLGTGSITGSEPIFTSTDINSPFFMHLAANAPAAITSGASDGSYMGARSQAEPLGLEMVEVTSAGAPVGFTAYDLVAEVGPNSDLGSLQLILDTDTLGDIYQNATAPDDPNETHASYVTIGVSGENSAQTRIDGGAVDLGGAASATFDTQNLDIAWSPDGILTGSGQRQIARVVLKNSASGSWTLKGWQTGGWDAVELTDSFGLLGDVDGNGFVGGGDLNTILGNWGMSGARRSQGDLTGEGDVGGADYNQVLGNWGAGTPPEPPAGIPEPATVGLLLLGSLLSLRRHKV